MEGRGEVDWNGSGKGVCGGGRGGGYEEDGRDRDVKTEVKWLKNPTPPCNSPRIGMTIVPVGRDVIYLTKVGNFWFIR
jgi:hypothetical protein